MNTDRFRTMLQELNLEIDRAVEILEEQTELAFVDLTVEALSPYLAPVFAKYEIKPTYKLVDDSITFYISDVALHSII